MQPTLWLSILAGYGLGVAAAALLLPGALAALALPVGIAAGMLVVATLAAATVDRARSKGPRPAAVAVAAEPMRRAPAAPTRAGGSDGAEAAGLSAADVRRALDEDRLEVFVQPIVSLPQRQAVFYEASTRIRDESGGLVLPARYLSAAEEAGLVSRIDLTLLSRCARVARRDPGADRQTRVFCRVSTRSLEDARFVGDAVDFLAGGPELAQRLVLELGHHALDGAASKALGELRRLGVGFGLDRPSTGGPDPAALARRGIGFVRIGARRFEAAAGLRDLDPKLIRLCGALAAAGITLIVDGIETGRALTEVLDYPVRYGQGRLFGAPEPLTEGLASPPSGTARAAERVYAWGLTWQKNAPALGVPATSPPG